MKIKMILTKATIGTELPRTSSGGDLNDPGKQRHSHHTFKSLPVKWKGRHEASSPTLASLSMSLKRKELIGTSSFL